MESIDGDATKSVKTTKVESARPWNQVVVREIVEARQAASLMKQKGPTMDNHGRSI
jgi:hypothetical protein